MGYLVPLIVAMGSLALPTLLEAPLRSLPAWFAAFFPALPYALAALARRAGTRGLIRTAGILERALSAVPYAAQIAIVWVFGWLGWIERMTGLEAHLDTWPGLEVFVGIAPFLLLTILAIDARARLHNSYLAAPRPARRPLGTDPYRDGVRRARVFQLRLFASALIPVGLYLALSGSVGAQEAWRVRLEEVDLLAAAFTVCTLLLFVLVLPRLVTSAWDTVPLAAGELRTQLEAVARRAGFRCRELLEWRTGAQMANAAIVGFTPKSRVVLFSDVLLATLRPDEVAAVFGHEMGHARRRHASIFAAYTIGVLLAVELVGFWLARDDAFLALAIVAIGVVVWLVSFSFLSRRFELEADLESLELSGNSRPLISALQAVTGAHAYTSSSWRHFSTEQRVRFLQAVELDQSIGVKLRRQLSWMSRAGVSFFALTLVLHVYQLSLGWTEGNLMADLRLGRYEQALERFESVAPDFELEQERLAQLIVAAQTIASDAREPLALEARALDAFTDREDSRTLDLLELAYLRGGLMAGDALDALQARNEGARDERAESALSDGWRAALDVRFRATEAP